MIRQEALTRPVQNTHAGLLLMQSAWGRVGHKEESQRRVGLRIADALTAADMNQAGLAARLKKSPAQVSRWINGESEIPLSELERLAEIVKRPMWYFLGAEPPNPDNIAGDAFNKLSPDHKAAVRAMIDALRAQETK